MGQVFFYHLTRSTLETTLPMLLTKSLQAGWHVVVRGRDKGRLEWLDQTLWKGNEEAFLPHGIAGGAHDALQPILLTTEANVPNNAQCLMSVDGAEVEEGELAGFERVCVLFDGNDPDALDHAREQWKSLTKSGAVAQYWSEAGGRWEKKAESGAQG